MILKRVKKPNMSTVPLHRVHRDLDQAELADRP